MFLIRVFLRDLFDRIGLTQNFPSHGDDHFTNLRYVSEMLATASKYLHIQFVFEQADLLADARLGGKQALRGSGHIQVVVRDLPDIAQLLQFHPMLLLSYSLVTP